MNGISPIDKWQLRRLDVLADMLGSIVNAYKESSLENAETGCAPIVSRLEEFQKFRRKVHEGKLNADEGTTSEWTSLLENAETDLIRSMYACIGNTAIEILHKACREEGKKWGKLAIKSKGKDYNDARNALLALNDYLIDGKPDDDNIEIISSAPQQVTYISHHCDFIDRFGQSQELAWALCSSRQAWKDGFFGAFNGVAHQNITSKCNGDDCCMRVITLTGE